MVLVEAVWPWMTSGATKEATSSFRPQLLKAIRPLADSSTEPGLRTLHMLPEPEQTTAETVGDNWWIVCGNLQEANYLSWKHPVRPRWWQAADTRPHPHRVVNPWPLAPLPGSQRSPSWWKTESCMSAACFVWFTKASHLSKYQPVIKYLTKANRI